MNKFSATMQPNPVGTTQWSKESLVGIESAAGASAPVLTAEQVRPMSPELDVWDSWPLADADGHPVAWRGGELWFALTVTRSDDPESRHHLARIHHFHRVDDHFTHLGQTLPDEIARGARQWSGSALYDNDEVTMLFTAAGHRGDTGLSYHQRIFATSTVLDDNDVFGTWSAPIEIIAADGLIYQPADQNDGEPGKIKAFRDPAHYRDENGQDYVLFTGSSAAEPGKHDGLIGLAVADEVGTYRLLPPLVTAVGVNNELERPHIVRKDGQLYLFWSTQRGVFAPEIAAPTGLYGATATSLDGPWELLNGTGLVVANPNENPTQAYSWWVLPDFSVASFVDYWGPEDGSLPELEARRARFGGTFAPFVHIEVTGSTSRLVGKPG